jgi:Glycosyl hydrolase family 76
VHRDVASVLTDEVHAARARATFEAIRASSLYNRRTNLWGRRRRWVFRRNEALWPYADAWSALCTLAGSPGGDAAMSFLPGLVGGLSAYHRRHRSALAGHDPVGFESYPPFPHGRGGDVFYDDNAWLGLALCCHHELTASAQAATLSRRLLDFIVTGWSDDQSWADPGGIRWKVPATCVTRNTCSNAPVAELAAVIACRDHDAHALEWSQRIYAWVHRTLRGTDGLYFDRIDPDGTVHREIYSYNQGSMIGAGVLLGQATGDAAYLSNAAATASAAMSRFSVDVLLTQDAAFNAVFFRNLFLLGHVRPNEDYRALAQQYADRMWSERRDSTSGLFSSHTGSPNTTTSFLNDTAPMMEIYALLAGSSAHP